MGNAKPPVLTLTGYDRKPAVRIATSNLFIEPETLDAEFAVSLFFEDISGNELINIQPYNFLINTSESNILNLNKIIDNYSPQSLFKSSNIEEGYFEQFEIDFNKKIPAVGNGVNGSNIYFVETDNSVYIEFVNIADDEEIEIEFVSKGTPIGDTIGL